MRVFSLFQLLLVVFAFYATVKFDEDGMRITVIFLCLVAVFLFERLQKRIAEDEEVRERLLRYKEQDRKKKLQAAQEKQQIKSDVQGSKPKN